MVNKYVKLFVCFCLALLGTIQSAVAQDSFVDFEITNADMSGEFDSSKLPDGVIFSGTKRGDNHGYGNVTLTVPVTGKVTCWHKIHPTWTPTLLPHLLELNEFARFKRLKITPLVNVLYHNVRRLIIHFKNVHFSPRPAALSWANLSSAKIEYFFRLYKKNKVFW